MLYTSSRSTDDKNETICNWVERVWNIQSLEYAASRPNMNTYELIGYVKPDAGLRLSENSVFLTANYWLNSHTSTA